MNKYIVDTTKIDVLPCNVKIGDIVKTRFYQGYDINHKVTSCPYRVIKISGAYNEPQFIDQINMGGKAPLTPPHYNFVVVSANIPVGHEKQIDWRYLNQYIPTKHLKFMRSTAPMGYLKIIGVAADAQPSLFN